MPLIKANLNLPYEALPDGTVVDANAARNVFGSSIRAGTVVKHEAVVRVKYLIELSNGERKWCSPVVERSKHLSSVKIAARVRDDDEDDEEDDSDWPEEQS